jgi:putative ABC transport system permease protein
MLLPRLINAEPQLTGASPTFEIARAMSYLRPLISAAEALGGLLVLIAAAGAATGLMATMNARTRDLALLRALGAGPWRLAGVAFAEAGMIGIAAALLGLLLTATAFTVGAHMVADETGLLLTAEFSLMEIVAVLGGALGVALLAALVPALRAARTPIEEALQA